ncbi:SOSS complex subunit B family protein [Haloarcula sp. H-GB5]
MYDTNATETGALESSHHDTHDLEYQTQTFQSIPLGNAVDNATGIIGDARTVDNNEMRIGWEREQAIENRASRRPDERVDPDRQDMTTETIERINGEQEELERHHERAHRAKAAEHDRAAACRDEVTNTDRHYTTHLEDGRPVRATPAPADHDLSTRFTPISDDTPDTDTLPSDPWPSLSQEEVAEINKSAKRLSEQFSGETAMGRASFASLLAKYVADGSTVTSALFTVKEGLESLPTVCQPIANIDPYDQYETTIEAEVVTLWQPKGDGQKQVGVVRDDSGESAKLTIWENAGDKPTLHEGDTVRVERVKVNAYQGDATLAVDSEAVVTRLTHGDGDAPQSQSATDDPTIPAWRADSDTHEWLEQGDAGGDPDAFLTHAEKERANAFVKGNINAGQFIGVDD